MVFSILRLCLSWIYISLNPLLSLVLDKSWSKKELMLDSEGRSEAATITLWTAVGTDAMRNSLEVTEGSGLSLLSPALCSDISTALLSLRKNSSSPIVGYLPEDPQRQQLLIYFSVNFLLCSCLSVTDLSVALILQFLLPDVHFPSSSAPEAVHS